MAGGLLNGLFGSGAGILCVLVLRGVTGDKKAHASSTLAVLIMSAASLALYLITGKADLTQSFRFMPGGVLGAAAGALWLKNIDSQKLRRLFGAVMAVSGAVMLLS